MEVVKNCPVCGGADYSQYIDCKDFTSSKKTFTIVGCSACGFLFTNPRPDENEIGEYYKGEDYVSHSGTTKGLINSLYHWVRGFTLNSKSSMIRGLHPTATTLLDYGAGTGDFLDTMRKSGFEVAGLEPSPEARDAAIKNHAIELRPITDLSSLANESFDVITLWHVMEHIQQLDKTIDELKRVLKPGGVMIIAVPNAESYDAQYFKEYWAAYDVPRHLYHFKIKSMTQLLGNHQLQVEKVLPMWFDSFYVSLLSIKYKALSTKNASPGIWGMLVALVVGALSNLMGVFNKKNFSSLIYVVKA